MDEERYLPKRPPRHKSLKKTMRSYAMMVEVNTNEIIREGYCASPKKIEALMNSVVHQLEEMAKLIRPKKIKENEG